MTWPWVVLILAPGSVGGAVLGVTLWLIYRRQKGRRQKDGD